MENIKQINSLLTSLGDRLILDNCSLKTFDGYVNEDFFAIEEIDKTTWEVYKVSRYEKFKVKRFDNEKEACLYFFINEYKTICFIRIRECIEKHNIALSLKTIDELKKALKIFKLKSKYFSIDSWLKKDAINIQSYENGQFKTSYINNDGVKKFEWESEILDASLYKTVNLSEFRNMEKMLLDEGFIQSNFEESILIDFL